MTTIDEIKNQFIKVLEEEIASRQKFIPTLIGGLYPNLLIVQVEKLEQLKKNIEAILK